MVSKNEFPLAGMKARARMLHRAAQAGASEAHARLRTHPQLGELVDAALADTVQRRHCLHVVAREHGFRDWPHARTVLCAAGEVEDFGTLLHPHRCQVHWNIWSASYDEAARIRADHGGFLLAYGRQFLIVDEHYIETLGLSPTDPDWNLLGRDWVRPASPEARFRLYAKLIDVGEPDESAC